MKFLSASEIWKNIPNKDVFVSLVQLAKRDNIGLYLVGGTVRDIILKRPIVDLDFAVSGNAIDFAYKFAEISDSICITLDERHDIARLIFHDKYFYMDFTGIRGTDIITDLIARDFTINAMAIDASKTLEDENLEIIDPTNGIKDLNDGIIRLASPRSFIDDPVRMFRAYRFAASLDFKIHDTAFPLIRDSLDRLSYISGERVRDELFKILSIDNSIRYLREMDDIGLMEKLFPEIIMMKDMLQNKHHYISVWQHSILTMEFFEQNFIPDSLTNYKSEIEGYLQCEPVIGRSRIALLKLAALFHDVGKPIVKMMSKNGRIYFLDHSTKGSEIMLDIGSRLRLANREIMFLKNVTREHMYPLGLCLILNEPRTANEKDRMIRKFIQKAGSELLAILMLSYADFKATRGEYAKDDYLDKLDKVIGDIGEVYFREAFLNKPKLITGSDIMKEFKLLSSPAVGKLIKQIENAQMEGKIKTREDAMEMIRNVLFK